MECLVQRLQKGGRDQEVLKGLESTLWYGIPGFWGKFVKLTFTFPPVPVAKFTLLSHQVHIAKLLNSHCQVTKSTLLCCWVHITRLPTPHQPSPHCQLAKSSSSCELPKFSSDQFFLVYGLPNVCKMKWTWQVWECELDHIAMWTWQNSDVDVNLVA